MVGDKSMRSIHESQAPRPLHLGHEHLTLASNSVLSLTEENAVDLHRVGRVL